MAFACDQAAALPMETLHGTRPSGSEERMDAGLAAMFAPARLAPMPTFLACRSNIISSPKSIFRPP